MVKVITQETFDAVVKENIEDFGLEANEAREDAIKQFEAQGVDLSNIVTDGGDSSSHPIIVLLDDLSNQLENEEAEEVRVINILKQLEAECGKDIAHRLMAEKNGAFNKLVVCMRQHKSKQLVREECLKCMGTLTKGYPDIVTHEGIHLLCEVLDETHPVTTVGLVLNVLCHSCRMHENNRENFMTNFQLGGKIRKLLEDSPSHMEPEIIVKCCQLIRTIVADDDVRVEFGRAHEYACMIADKENGLEILSSLLTVFGEEKTVIKELLPTLSRLAVRNEYCQKIVECGGLNFVVDVLVKYYDDKELVESSFFLIKALAGNDDVKREVGKGNAIALITAALDRHKSILSVAEIGCGAVAALTLRMPDNASTFVSNGVAQLLTDILKGHTLKVSVERQASMAIRNIVSRKKELASSFIDAGVEELLQNALKRTQKAPIEEIKAALRDLGCQVQLKEQWTGKGVQVTN